jgi:hypothetical protein
MSDTALHAIKSALDNNAAEFKDAIVDMLGTKVQSALQLQKTKYANSYFSDEVASEEDEEQEDQEGTTDD